MSLNRVITLSSLQQKLKKAGYDHIEQIVYLEIDEITRELGLNHSEHKELTQVIKEELVNSKVINQNEQLNSISTQSNNINSLFGSGVPPQKITEICGVAGTGKTQLCMQLGINSLQKGDCIYIDTEGSCSLNGRLGDISSNQNIDKFHLFPVSNHAELMAMITQLPAILDSFPNTKLIIIDSITFHFRVNVLSKVIRDGLLNFIGATLTKIAKEKNVAVAVVNHVTQEDENSAWIPSLGSSWGNWCNSRLFLYRRRNFRFAYLYKLIDSTVNRPVQFCIKDHGISDPIEEELEIIDTGQTQQQIDNAIEFTFTQLKKEKDENDEQEKVDDFWNDAYSNVTTSISNIVSTEAPKDHPNNSQSPQLQEKNTPTIEDSQLTRVTVEEDVFSVTDPIPSTQLLINNENFIPATQIPSSFQDDEFIPATQVTESRGATKKPQVEEDSLESYTDDVLSWGGHEKNSHASDQDFIESFEASNDPEPLEPPCNFPTKSLNREPSPACENIKLKGKTAVYSEIHRSDQQTVYEEEEKVTYEIKNRPNSKPERILSSEDESLFSTSSRDRSKLNGIKYSTRYSNHEIIYSATQEKPIVYETDHEGYLYSTQDKSILETIHSDAIHDTVENEENIIQEKEDASNQDDIFSLSVLSSEDEDNISSVKRKHDSDNTSLEEFSRKSKGAKAVHFNLASDSQASNGTESSVAISKRNVATNHSSNEETADWDSDEEEQLDYIYIKEMNEYV